MNDYKNTINTLRNKIEESLLPAITGNYYHLDNPYHNNIGDNLIWEGEKEFLKKIPYKNLGVSSSESWGWNQLQKGEIILLHGGGNFGDLYRGAQDFRLEVIKRYPNNKIIMFPQSVFYEDQSLIEKDVSIMEKHQDLILCIRDLDSYQFMKKYFGKCNIILLPDMAFCISDEYLIKFRNKEQGKDLFLRRLDKEFVNSSVQILDSIEVRDWPTIERSDLSVRIARGFVRLGKHFYNFPIISKGLSRIGDFVADKIMRPRLVEKGCKFLAPYNRIITTRLHVLILGVLLNKNIEYIDNSSKKLSAYAETWLKDAKNVKKADVDLDNVHG